MHLFYAIRSFSQIVLLMTVAVGWGGATGRSNGQYMIYMHTFHKTEEISNIFTFNKFFFLTLIHLS